MHENIIKKIKKKEKKCSRCTFWIEDDVFEKFKKRCKKEKISQSKMLNAFMDEFGSKVT